MRQLTLDLSAPVRPALANFVVGPNVELDRAIRECAAGTLKETSLYIWGPAGAGKSHLLSGVVDAAQAAGHHAVYVSCESGRIPEVDLTDVDLLAVDDVDRLDAAGQVKLFNVYNTLRDSGRRLVSSGSAPPAALTLRPDVLTRLGWGLVYQVHALTDDEKAHALTEYAARRSFTLTPDIADHLLNRVRRDMPTLLAVVDAIDRYSLEVRKPVTLALVRQLLRDSGTASESERVRVSDSGEGSDGDQRNHADQVNHVEHTHHDNHDNHNNYNKDTT
jgi:DnaA family protein